MTLEAWVSSYGGNYAESQDEARNLFVALHVLRTADDLLKENIRTIRLVTEMY